MKALRDPIWQFVAAVFALVTLIAAYNISFMSQPKKEIRVVLRSAAPLVQIKPEVANDIEVFYKGQKATSISLVQIQIANSGNQPITESDYSRPISFSFETDIEIVDASVTESIPKNIGLVVTKTSKSQAQVRPTLLNPGDTVTIRFLTIQDKNASSNIPVIDGRVAGVKEITLTAPTEQDSAGTMSAIVSLFLGGLTGIVTTFFSDYFVKLARRTRYQIMSSRGRLLIESATYGANDNVKDVAGILNTALIGRQPSSDIPVSNEQFGGDPSPGIAKELILNYWYNGQRRMRTFREGETLSLTKLKE